MRRTFTPGLMLCFLLALAGARRAQAQSNTLTSPAFTIFPATFPAAQQASAVVTIANGNAQHLGDECRRRHGN